MAARKIRLYCSTIWLSIQIPSNPVLAGAFSRIRSNEFEKTVEKEAMWAKVQMKGVPKGRGNVRKLPLPYYLQTAESDWITGTIQHFGG